MVGGAFADGPASNSGTYAHLDGDGLPPGTRFRRDACEVRPQLPRAGGVLMANAMAMVGFVAFAVGTAWWIAGVKSRRVDVPMLRRLLSRSRYPDPQAQSNMEQDAIKSAQRASRVGGWLALLGVTLILLAYGVESVSR